MCLFAEYISPILYEKMVLVISKESDLHSSLDKKFDHCKEATYAVDVMFHRSNRLTGAVSKARPYLSGKHRQYGRKIEACVIPQGLAIHTSAWSLGHMADIDVFREGIDAQKCLLKKSSRELLESDTGILKENTLNFGQPLWIRDIKV